MKENDTDELDELARSYQSPDENFYRYSIISSLENGPMHLVDVLDSVSEKIGNYFRPVDHAEKYYDMVSALCDDEILYIKEGMLNLSENGKKYLEEYNLLEKIRIAKNKVIVSEMRSKARQIIEKRKQKENISYKIEPDSTRVDVLMSISELAALVLTDEGKSPFKFEDLWKKAEELSGSGVLSKDYFRVVVMGSPSFAKRGGKDPEMRLATEEDEEF